MFLWTHKPSLYLHFIALLIWNYVKQNCSHIGPTNPLLTQTTEETKHQIMISRPFTGVWFNFRVGLLKMGSFMI